MSLIIVEYQIALQYI